MTEGWIAGMVVEAALKGAGLAGRRRPKCRCRCKISKSTSKAFAAVRSNGPRTIISALKQYYRVYRWDGSKIAMVKDWFSYDVK